MPNTEPTSQVERFNQLTQAHAFINQLLSQTHRQLDILSGQLRADLFAEPQLLKAITHLASSSPSIRIRLLLAQLPATGRAHPLIALQSRLNSKFALRVINPTDQPPRFGMLCGDRQQLVYFNNEALLEGFYCQHARAESRHALHIFDDAWQSRSIEHPELQALKI